MSGDVAPQLEHLLRQALAPVEPPDDLALRLERTLQSLSDLAAEELESWELRAMRDPRNWARPAAAVVVGGAAGAALVVLRARRHHPAAPARSGIGGARDVAERALRDVGTEARRVIRRG
ncbi:MAG TPA: hypothetical protein VHX88_20580 [Solirubrobacteraceae bacterium]|nr:hypothetical protein [Solirubrobacteraceae bacterium]